VSWERVDRYVLRCDGPTARGQCENRAMAWVDDEPPVQEIAVWEKPEPLADMHWLRRGGEWALLPDGTVRCPDHKRGLERMAAASLDGLPFDAPSGVTSTPKEA
jgi:hypothetical protein